LECGSVRVYPARQKPYHDLCDRDLQRLVEATMNRARAEDPVDWPQVQACAGVVFVRASARLQRAVAEGFGWSDAPFGHIRTFTLERPSDGKWRAAKCSSRPWTRSRINP
jgi:hypothetical protein